MKHHTQSHAPLSATDVARYLREALTPPLAPQILTALFGGRRPSEPCLLVWEGESLDRLEIRSHSHNLRLVTACPAIKSWLAPYHGYGPRDCCTVRDRRALLAELRLAIPHATLQQLRITYAVCRLAQTGMPDRVASELGLSMPLLPPPILGWRGHDDAERLLSLTPETCGRPTWADEVKAWRRGRDI